MTADIADASDGCFHCSLPLPEKLTFETTVNGSTRQFCCPACQAVCRAIYDAGLDGFYHRIPQGSLAPPAETAKDLALYDLDEVQAEFVTDLGVQREIHLLVEGIHCAACVWLIERSLSQMPGILNAQVNLSGRRLLLKWDNDQIRLSQVLNHLGKIGYAAIPYDPEVAEGRLKKQNRSLLLRMAFAAFAMMNLLWVSIALYSGASEGEFRSLFHWVGFSLATPTLLYSGYPFLHSAWTGIKRLHFTMDLPIAIGAIVTYSYSVYITLNPSAIGEVYYDTVVNFLFVILVGRYLEAMTKRQAVDSTQRLLELQPRAATVLRDGESVLLPIRAIKPGDLVLIKPGEQIPVDGMVMQGHSKVDESMLSGESHPLDKQEGDKVSAGTMNTDSTLTVRVAGILRNTSLGRIINLVEEAQASKAPIQCTADRIVPWFVATTLLLSSMTFFWWLKIDFELALMAATAVLIITCPCAFGLATPMAIASASGLAARFGILVKNGGVLETLSHIDHIVFDKTGTLTEGRMRVQEILTRNDMDKHSLMQYAAALEHYSEHHIANAVCRFVEKKKIPLFSAQHIENFPGNGIKGIVNNNTVMIGTQQWLKKNHTTLDETLKNNTMQWENKGSTCVHVAVNNQHMGVIVINDQLRPDAKTLVDALRAKGIRMTILSGDRKPVVERIAHQLGGMESIAEVLPEDKDKIIQQLKKDGTIVAMIGDGINDAAALSRADVGIALGSGTDVSGDNADIVLMSNELDKVRLAMQLSQRTLRTIRQNIAISFTYNIIMVPLAMAAMITPLVAAISMPVSSLLVIANAARIRTVFNQKTFKEKSRQEKHQWK
ncbi:MAG: heavy metal translocating P-type ATPase [Gammaproteobacteria bacterium]|nr:heavy metal translocating P-type ATPase [Gammaproteobacteria bacterium]